MNPIAWNLWNHFGINEKVPGDLADLEKIPSLLGNNL